jgi:hypothetical protein
MTTEESKLREEHRSNVRRTKRLLRFLPRRGNIHTYPIIRFFAATARKTPFLWSFKEGEVVRALYAGCIISFMPLFGVQWMLAFAAAFVVRGNLPILLALQLISQPLTVPFIYTAAFFIGDFFISVFGAPSAIEEVGSITAETNLLSKSVRVYAALSFGGAVIGYFAGFISSVIYRVTSKRASRTFHRIRELQRRAKPPASNPQASTSEAS